MITTIKEPERFKNPVCCDECRQNADYGMIPKNRMHIARYIIDIGGRQINLCDKHAVALYKELEREAL